MCNSTKKFIISFIKSEDTILYYLTFKIPFIIQIINSTERKQLFVFANNILQAIVKTFHISTLRLIDCTLLKQANERSQLKINQFWNKKKKSFRRVSTCGRTFINLIRHITLVIFLITREKGPNFEGNCFSPRGIWREENKGNKQKIEKSGITRVGIFVWLKSFLAVLRTCMGKTGKRCVLKAK